MKTLRPSLWLTEDFPLNLWLQMLHQLLTEWSCCDAWTRAVTDLQQLSVFLGPLSFSFLQILTASYPEFSSPASQQVPITGS